MYPIEGGVNNSLTVNLKDVSAVKFPASDTVIEIVAFPV
jgi:hypothetical protein